MISRAQGNPAKKCHMDMAFSIGGAFEYGYLNSNAILGMFTVTIFILSQVWALQALSNEMFVWLIWFFTSHQQSFS